MQFLLIAIGSAAIAVLFLTNLHSCTGGVERYEIKGTIKTETEIRFPDAEP